MASISGMAKRRDRSPESSGIFLEPSSSRMCIRSGADSEFLLELEELVEDATTPSWTNSGQLVGVHQFSDPTYFSSSDSLRSSISLSLSELLGEPDLCDTPNLELGPDSEPGPPPYTSTHMRAGLGLGRNFRHHISAVGQMSAPVSGGAVQAQDFTNLIIPGCSCPGCCSSGTGSGSRIQPRSQSVPTFKPAPAPRLSVSESALGLQSGGGPTYWNWMRDGVNNDGGLYRAPLPMASSNNTRIAFPSSNMIMPPRSASPALAATTAAISAISQARAQMESFTNSNSSGFRIEEWEEKSNWNAAARPRDSSGSSLSSPGVRSASKGFPTSIGLSFSKLASASASGASNSSRQSSDGDSRLQLVQLLVSCAEAVACRDVRQASDLLRALRGATSPHGDAMQRVGGCFAEGLGVRISSNPLAGTFKTSGGGWVASSGSGPGAGQQRVTTRQERQEAMRLLCQSFPYVAFGHYAANAAILEAFAGEERLHIIDLGTSDGSLQWPSLLYGLASREGGKPASLRITAVGVESNGCCQERVERAALEAGIALSFRAIPESLENLSKVALEVREGEALAVNSVLHLHCVVKESRSSLNAVLQSIRKLSPKVLTLVEQDASHNGPFFMGRFVEALHYYSAIFESLDAILPRYSTQRVKIEQFHFAEEIRNIVSCEGHARVERHERVDQWRRRMSRAGFQPTPLKFVEQARQWLAKYDCAGYTLAEDKGCLLLGWNAKPIVAASCWRC